MTAVEVSVVTLADWHATLPENVLGGSLFAVPAAARELAAVSLFDSGCGIHADIMIHEDGTVTGLSPKELRAARIAAPAGLIDAHIMYLGKHFSAAVDAAIRAAIASVVAIDVVRIATTRSVIDRFRRDLDELRARGIAVWIEIAPEDDGSGIDRQRVDGALVMFIPSGTVGTADAKHLDKVAILSSFMPVGADGGITAELCSACIDAGASYVVSGRALLRATPTTATNDQGRTQS